jgi:sugar phosphate isomerase/epimerase
MSRALHLSTSSVNPMKVESAFIAAAATGYEGIELMISPSKETQNLGYIKDLIQKYSIPVTSIHAPTLLLCKFVWGTNPGLKLKKSVEFAEQIGATSVVVHPPFKTNPYAHKFLANVNHLNNNSAVDVAVENMFPWTFKGRSKEIYGPSWEEAIKTAENLTFDFSHASLSGMDVMKFFTEHHQKVRVIHLTDGSTRTNSKADSIKDEHLIPGEGQMPIREVYQFLNEQNWLGDTVLEINTRQHAKLEDKLPALTTSRDFFTSIN